MCSGDESVYDQHRCLPGQWPKDVRPVLPWRFQFCCLCLVRRLELIRQGSNRGDGVSVLLKNVSRERACVAGELFVINRQASETSCLSGTL